VADLAAYVAAIGPSTPPIKSSRVALCFTFHLGRFDVAHCRAGMIHGLVRDTHPVVSVRQLVASLGWTLVAG
jgi:hypothetical protein